MKGEEESVCALFVFPGTCPGHLLRVAYDWGHDLGIPLRCEKRSSQQLQSTHMESGVLLAQVSHNGRTVVAQWSHSGHTVVAQWSLVKTEDMRKVQNRPLGLNSLNARSPIFYKRALCEHCVSTVRALCEHCASTDVIYRHSTYALTS